MRWLLTYLFLTLVCISSCGTAGATETPVELCRLAALSAGEKYDKENLKALAWLQPLLNEQIDFLESITKQIGEAQWKDAANYVRARDRILKDYFFSEETRRHSLGLHEGNLDMTRGAILLLINDQESSVFQQIAGRRFTRQICPDSSRGQRPLPEGFGSPALIDQFVTPCGVDRTGANILPTQERRYAVVSQNGEPSVIARTFVRGPLGDAALESRINLLTRQIEGRDLHSALRMVSGEAAEATLLGRERFRERFFGRTGVGLACDGDQAAEPQEISHLCRLAETRAIDDLKSRQTHPWVVLGEGDARMQAALLAAQVRRLSAQDRRDLNRYRTAYSEAKARGPEAAERVEIFYNPLRKRLSLLLNRQSVFEGFTPTRVGFEEQVCPAPRSAALNASRVSGRNDWRDMMRLHFPEYLSSCRVSGPDEDKHTLPLLQRRAGVEMKAGNAIAWATTFHQISKEGNGAPSEMMLMETKWDLIKNEVKGTHFSDALKSSSLQVLNDAALTEDSAIDAFLRAHGVLNICRPDVNFLDQSPDSQN